MCCISGRSLCLIPLPLPLPASRQHLNNDDYLEDKRVDYQNFCAVFCVTVVHSDMHKRAHFLQLTFGSGLHSADGCQ